MDSRSSSASTIPYPPHAGGGNLPWRRRRGPYASHSGLPESVASNSPVQLRTRGPNRLRTGSPFRARALPHPPAEDLRARFHALANRWREETEFHSAISALYMHPAYQEIIGMGPDVLPLLLEDLAATRTDWFWALRSISRENPVPAEERGKINRMTERWLTWGHERGFL